MDGVPVSELEKLPPIIQWAVILFVSVFLPALGYFQNYRARSQSQRNEQKAEENKQAAAELDLRGKLFDQRIENERKELDLQKELAAAKIANEKEQLKLDQQRRRQEDERVQRQNALIDERRQKLTDELVEDINRLKMDAKALQEENNSRFAALRMQHQEDIATLRAEHSRDLEAISLKLDECHQQHSDAMDRISYLENLQRGMKPKETTNGPSSSNLAG